MAYEEARKLRLEENHKRFQVSAASQLSAPKNLSLKLAKLIQVVNNNLSYIARPLHECKFASYEEKVGAVMAAEEFQSRLGSPHPSFVKSIVRSHVYSCFWLGIPSRFCVAHLPEETLKMILEDEKGKEYEAVYIGTRSGLSGGWKRFALDHKFDDGDALLFSSYWLNQRGSRSTCLKETRTQILQPQEREAERDKGKKIRMLKNQVMREAAQDPQRESPRG